MVSILLRLCQTRLTITSSLTKKLMVRVTNYFDTQVRVPSSGDGSTRRNSSPDQEAQINGTPKARHAQDLTQRKMTDQQMIGWYSKILESVRLRYRKLQRFARYACAQSLVDICTSSWVHSIGF